MENWTIVPWILVTIVVALNSFQANSVILSPPYWLSIDCGATSQYQDEINKDLTWQTDDEFVQTGENKFMPSLNTSFLHMKTLRSFPNGTQNCYKLPLKARSKYLLRAGFLYGNYDNLLKPPRFGLRIVGYANVVVSIFELAINDPVYHEFFFVMKTKTEVVEVCLVRTKEDHVPFISSIEATLIGDWAYKFLTNETALYLESRINYGANQSVPERFNNEAEIFNRIWEPQEIPAYPSLSSDHAPDWYSLRSENNPPFKILVHAIAAKNASESIYLPVKIHRSYQEPLSAYFIFYLAVVSDKNSTVVNETRMVSIYIDGREKATTFVPYWFSLQEAAVVSVYPVNVSGGTANVTISAAGESALPPILNALEVFSVVVDSKAVVGSHVFRFRGFSFCFVLLFSWMIL